MYDAEEVSRLPALLSQEILVSHVSSIWMTVTLPGGALLWWYLQSSSFDFLFKVGRAESSTCGLASTLSRLRCRPLWHFHCWSGLVRTYMVQKLWKWSRIELNCFAFSQGDDFKTPEGDVEDNPEDFANKLEHYFSSKMHSREQSWLRTLETECEKCDLEADEASLQVASRPAMPGGEAFLGWSLRWQSGKKVEWPILIGRQNTRNISKNVWFFSIKLLQFLQGDGWAGVHQDQRQCLQGLPLWGLPLVLSLRIATLRFTSTFKFKECYPDVLYPLHWLAHETRLTCPAMQSA